MKLAVYISLTSLIAATALFAQDDLFKPMKGTATPSFQMSDGTKTCLVFGKHIVKMAQSEDGGENVSIWMREGTARGADACQVKVRPYAVIRDSDNNSFNGISTDFFFIDQGTSAGSRTLLVYQTDTGREVTSVGYQNDPTLEAGRFLLYDEPTDKKGPISTCPQAAKWKREGGGVGWVQGKKMDLKTLTKTNVGALRCVYME